jgi:hypothetical protein
MGVNYGVHVRPRFVYAGVKMEFQRRLAVAFDHLPVEIDGANIVDRELAALTGADIDQQAMLAEADARMAIVINDARPLEHANTAYKLMFLRFGFVHVVLTFTN